MKKTLVINFAGGPGVGKSYMALRVASNLKERQVSCEYVPEFAKDLVYEERKEELNDQLYILAMQNHMLKRVKDKVNVIITDCPIFLSMYYNEANGSFYNSEILNQLILDAYNSFDNIVYLVKRNHPYVKEGRYQTEEESIIACEKIKQVLDKNNIKYESVVSSRENADKITDFIVEIVKLYENNENNIEYERKFLLKEDRPLKLCYSKKHIIQNYLNLGEGEKRIRSVDNKKYYYTEKIGKGDKRKEYEKEITRSEYIKLKEKFSVGKTIEKDRYCLKLDGTKSCEINIFSSPKPIKLIEVEFEDEESMKNFVKPDWFGEEVTQNKDFYNYNIAMNK